MLNNKLTCSERHTTQGENAKHKEQFKVHVDWLSKLIGRRFMFLWKKQGIVVKLEKVKRQLKERYYNHELAQLPCISVVLFASKSVLVWASVRETWPPPCSSCLPHACTSTHNVHSFLQMPKPLNWTRHSGQYVLLHVGSYQLEAASTDLSRHRAVNDGRELSTEEFFLEAANPSSIAHIICI